MGRLAQTLAITVEIRSDLNVCKCKSTRNLIRYRIKHEEERRQFGLGASYRRDGRRRQQYKHRAEARRNPFPWWRSKSIFCIRGDVQQEIRRSFQPQNYVFWSKVTTRPKQKKAPKWFQRHFCSVTFCRAWKQRSQGGGQPFMPTIFQCWLTHRSTGPIAACRHLGYKSLAQMPSRHNGPVSSNVRRHQIPIHPPQLLTMSRLQN